MGRKKKLTKLQQAYQKEINRLKNYQRRAEKRGLTFTQPLAPTLPKRVTQKKLQEIKSFRPRKLKGYDIVVDKSTGEVLAEQTYTPTISNLGYVEDLIKDLPSEIYTRQGYTEISEIKDTMLSTLYDTLAEYDDETSYDDYLGTILSDLQSSLNSVEYSSDQSAIYTNYAKALSLIKGSALTMSEARSVADYMDVIDYE